MEENEIIEEYEVEHEEQEQEQEEPQQEVMEQEQEQEEPQKEVVEQEQEEPKQEVTEQEHEEQQQENGENEEDTFVNALRRLVYGDSQEDISEEEENEISVNQLEEQNESIETIDYSIQLQSILTEIGITNSDLEEFIDAYTEQNETNNINAALNSQSCTNVLLIVIITLMLSKFTVHLVRGIL